MLQERPKARKLRTRLAQHLLYSLRYVFFQPPVVTRGISFCECRRRFAGAGGEDREEIARPGASNWIECDAGGGVGHGAPDPFDDDLVRVGEQDAQVWVDCGLDIFAVTSRRERMRLVGAEKLTL